MPNLGEPCKKTINGKDYVVCENHGNTKWVLKISPCDNKPHLETCHARPPTSTNSNSSEITANTTTTGTNNFEDAEPIPFQKKAYAKALAHMINAQNIDDPANVPADDLPTIELNT